MGLKSMTNSNRTFSLACCAIALLCTSVFSLAAQTIAEKKAGVTAGGGEFDSQTLRVLQTVNTDLVSKEKELRELYYEVQVLYQKGAPPADFRAVLGKINAAREEVARTADIWRETLDQNQRGEGYALWNQPKTTIGQLVMDFGSQEYVYVIPPDIGKVEIGIASTIPVPRALWGEMLEMILAQNGVGVRQLNPYVRLLYSLDKNQSGLSLITNKRDDLEYLPPSARVGYLISPDPSEVRRVGFFLERFMNPKTTTLQMVGRDMLIVSTVAEVKELLKLYDFVSATRGQMEYRLVPLQRVNTDEMAKVLQAMFEQFNQDEQVFTTADGKAKTPPSPKKNEGHGLKVIPLKDVAQAVFLVGTREEIERAMEIIYEVENAVGTAREKVVYTYRVKHSEPDAIGKLVNSIYTLLVAEGIANQQPQVQMFDQGIQGVPGTPGGPTAPGNSNQLSVQQRSGADVQTASPTINVVNPSMPRHGMYYNPFPTVVDDTPGFFMNGQFSINPTPIRYDPSPPEEINKGRDNFLVDPRSNNIVMVVDPVLLPRIKALLKRIDVPKKQVQLDVLLVEFSDAHTTNYGLKLLSVGGCASNTRHTCMRFDDVGQLRGNSNAAIPGMSVLAAGVTEFFLARPRSDGWPAFDLSYQFLMSQTEATITANPTIMTLNEEKASIQIKREISISTGIVEVVGTNQNVGPKDAFTRAQYGTQIDVTPTVHTRGDDPEEFWDAGPDYVTLDNYILFDDALPSTDPSRPNVLRRQVKTKVDVADGQTAVVGGLKRKDINDSWAGIPYLGELPGVGKLFSYTDMSDTSSETFIFITPRILYDHCESIEKVKREQLMRRPGDLPYFMETVADAVRCERERAFHLSMQMVFGRERQRAIWWGDDACLREDGRRGTGRAESFYERDPCCGGGACGGCSAWDTCPSPYQVPGY